MRKPLCIELFAGCSTWAAGWRDLGGHSIGFDIEHLPHHDSVPPNCDLVLQDVLTLHGSQFRNADLILASPPCQAYSYRAMPWKRAKALPPPSNELFDACFRLQREAIEATKICQICGGKGMLSMMLDSVVRHSGSRACGVCQGTGRVDGRYIPMVVENVCGAQRWVGRAAWHYGSFYLWGDVPAIMPNLRHLPKRAMDDRKNGKFRHCADGALKGSGGWFGDYEACKDRVNESIKQGGDWFNALQPSMSRMCSSKSPARKAASAAIARIPYDLSLWIAQVYWPDWARASAGALQHAACEPHSPGEFGQSAQL